MVSCIMKNFYHFSKRLYIMLCRDMICRDGNIDAAPASRIVEDLRERVDMYFKTVYDEKDSWPTEYGDKMQWAFVAVCRYVLGTYPRHVLPSYIADSIYEIEYERWSSFWIQRLVVKHNHLISANERSTAKEGNENWSINLMDLAAS